MKAVLIINFLLIIACDNSTFNCG